MVQKAFWFEASILELKLTSAARFHRFVLANV